MSGTFVFIICIVAIVMCANIIQTIIKQKHSAPDNHAELEETMSKIDSLEERIKVLERIITESRFDLKKEIDSL